MNNKFKIGDIVIVTKPDFSDLHQNIAKGDVFKILQDSDVPNCKPIKSNYEGKIKCFIDHQLELATKLSEVLS